MDLLYGFMVGMIMRPILESFWDVGVKVSSGAYKKSRGNPTETREKP